MAIAGPTRGCSGTVTAFTAATGSFVAVGFLTDYTIDQTSALIDASVMGSCTKSFVAGAKQTNVTINALWDGDNSTQALFVIGNTLHLKIYPEGTASTANYYKTPSGGAVLTSHNITGGGVDGVVSATFGFTVNGQLTATAV